jgi:ParB family chromosome partitioning protein
LIQLDPADLLADPENVRASADDPDLSGLAQSLAEYGVLQPLGVRRRNGHYQVVFGDRRRRAAVLAGLKAVPCIEVDGGEDLLVHQVIENVQRRQLNPIEQAEVFARLRKQAERAGAKGDAEAFVARQVGLSTATVRRYLALRELAPGVRDRLRDDELSVTQAQHLRQVPDGDAQEALAGLAIERGLSARQLRIAATALTNRPGLAPLAAVELAERDEAPPAPVATVKREASPKLPARPKAEDAEEVDYWADEPEDDDSEFAPPPIATADGNRVFRIRTIDSFCDEVARLARAVQEGDLTRAANEDPASPLKLGLAAKQLDFIRRAIAETLRG